MCLASRRPGKQVDISAQGCQCRIGMASQLDVQVCHIPQQQPSVGPVWASEPLQHRGRGGCAAHAELSQARQAQQVVCIRVAQRQLAVEGQYQLSQRRGQLQRQGDQGVAPQVQKLQACMQQQRHRWRDSGNTWMKEPDAHVQATAPTPPCMQYVS